MTAIVGVLNKHAVAIAADSAVTMGDTHKVINSGNKIFTLSKYHPVAIMTYNAAEFMGTPWEIIIKQYRKQLGDEPKSTLEEYLHDFVDYLTKQNYLTSEDVQKESLYMQAYFFYKLCVDRAVGKAFAQKRPFKLTDPNVFSYIKTELEEIIKSASSKKLCETLQDYSLKDFLTYSKDVFDRLYNETLPIPMVIPEVERSYFEEVFYNYMVSEVAFTAYTGLVFTGYGEQEMFPSIMSLKVSLFIDGRLKYFIENDRTFHVTTFSGSCIAPYAQDDVIKTIMGGMYPGFVDIINQVVRSSVLTYTGNVKKLAASNPSYSGLIKELNKFDNEAFIRSIDKSISDQMFEKYTKNLISTVSGLGKEDMANMAESFISLTSLVRRMSPHEETVGGPVDVAVISKGDGFVWINRKHYFNPEYNHHFFQNYFK